MKKILIEKTTVLKIVMLLCIMLVVGVSSVFAQSSPLTQAIDNFVQFILGPVARGFALVAWVAGGLMLTTEHSGRHIPFLLIGTGLAVLAVQVVAWLFGV